MPCDAMFYPHPHEKKQPGVENVATQSTSPVGLFVGLGVEVGLVRVVRDVNDAPFGASGHA